MCPGREHYSGAASAFLTLTAGQRQPVAPAASVLTTPDGVRLTNSRLDIWISLGAHDGSPWLAGAATSVVVDVRDHPDILRDRLEVLDAYRGLVGAFGHDPEKRCMQLDSIRLSLPAADDLPLYDQVWECVSASAGPVRATATLCSPPFAHSYVDPVTRRGVDLECRVLRVISLYRDADYVLEEICVTGALAGEEKTLPLHFSLRYFADLDMGLYPAITHHAHIPDWFSVSCSSAPFQGYGFATNVHSAPVRNPYPWFLRPEEEALKSFSWDLGVGDQVTCLHLFRFSPPADLAAETGRAWYSHVYKPLKATIA